LCGHDAYAMNMKELLVTQVLTSMFCEEKFYGDNTETLLGVANEILDSDAKFVVNLVKYCNANEEQRKMFRKVSICYMDYAFFNDDWYILIDKRGNFHYDVVIGNPQALKEMKATLAVISEMTKKKEIEEYYLSFKNNNICI